MRLLFISLVVSATVSAQLTAQTAPTDSVVHHMLRERVDAGRFAGIVVGVVSRDNARRVIAYGPNAGVQPFDGNTVFEIGSITKTFTASILADMVRTHEVALDDAVSGLLPTGAIVPERNGRKITLLDLATQSSGLPSLPDNFKPEDNENPYVDYTAQQLYAFLGTYQLSRDIGSKYEYSNMGVGLLGQALANRAHPDYETLVTARVLTPLKMRDTRITLTLGMQLRLAPGHKENGSAAKNWDLPVFAGAGALRSTVNDMLTYVRAHADSTSIPLGATLATTHGERRAGPVPRMTVGLAWHRLKTPAGRTLVWHNGGTGGYRSFAGFDEATGQGVVVLTNTALSVDDIGFHLLDGSMPLTPLPKGHVETTLSQATLQSYVGQYEVAPNFVLTISRDGTQLYAQATGQPRTEIFAEAMGAFFLKVVDAQLTFTTGPDGVVSGLVLHQNGGNLAGKRIK